MAHRIVSGLDAQGKSTVLINEDLRSDEAGAILAWMTTGAPADNSEIPSPDVVPNFDLMHSAASTFLLVRMPPGSETKSHATDTIDYITMISGHISFGTETGQVTLSAGDILVDRGVIHSWWNDGDEDAVYSVVALPASPVGGGRTV